MTATGPAAATSEPRCDHICLKDDGHVLRGEPHFYGYENPPPRSGVALGWCEQCCDLVSMSNVTNGSHNTTYVGHGEWDFCGPVWTLDEITDQLNDAAERVSQMAIAMNALLTRAAAPAVSSSTENGDKE